MKHILSLIISGALVVSGFGQTRNVLVNTNNVVVQPTNFWSADASNARSGLGLGSAATNASSAFQGSSLVLSNLASSNAVNLTNLRSTNIVGTIPSSNIPTISLTNISGTLAIVSGGTGATNAATARTNLGLGWSALTNTNSENFRTNINLGWNFLTNSNSVQFFNQILNTVDESSDIRIPSTTLISAGSSFGGIDPTNYDNVVALKYVSVDDDGTGGVPTDHDTWTVASPSKFRSAIGIPLSALTNTTISNFRSAIGLPLLALTNTNNANFLAAFFGSNTNPVLVNTNGTVVSPTNFWQQAPIATTVLFSEPITNSTNTATNSRNLIIQSLATNIVNVTNTLLLPTNTSTFNGDTAVVIHGGGANSATAVRQAGQTSNLIVITNFDHAVRFLYFNNTWDFYHNLAYVEPIYFSGTNAAANAATSRENLGIGQGSTNLIGFGTVRIPSSGISFIESVDEETVIFIPSDTDPVILNPIHWNHSSVRSNIGIPLAALTNTNNANFQAAVFATNAAPTNSANVNTVNFNTATHWMEVTVKTNGTNATFRIPLFQ